jgi:hypothetical protein
LKIVRRSRRVSSGGCPFGDRHIPIVFSSSKIAPAGRSLVRSQFWVTEQLLVIAEDVIDKCGIVGLPSKTR